MHRIILDTDPGIDDALALFLNASKPLMRGNGMIREKHRRAKKE
jgi:inosine-uridine nucleoside N-ribohydrolase